MDLLTSIAFILTAGKVTNTLDVSWFWIFAPLYLRASIFLTACFADALRDPNKENEQ